MVLVTPKLEWRVKKKIKYYYDIDKTVPVSNAMGFSVFTLTKNHFSFSPFFP